MAGVPSSIPTKGDIVAEFIIAIPFTANIAISCIAKKLKCELFLMLLKYV